ncbi:MAG: SPOR domain-containing protein [Thiomargarita sp.]|nr:SPOR domain-containing protein [Thiomargarita sp.]
MKIPKRRTRMKQPDYISPNCPSGWAWLLAGIVIGIFISFLIYLREFAPQEFPAKLAQVTNPSIVEKTEHNISIMDFYSDLEESDETIETEIKPPLLTETNGQQVTQPGRYILQIGSYRNQSQAEGFKSYVISLGIPAYIEVTGFNNTGRWYRVQVGPFTDLDKLNNIQQLLEANKIPILLKKF